MRLFTELPRGLIFSETQHVLPAGWIIIDLEGLKVGSIASCWARMLVLGSVVSVVFSGILTILLNLPFLFSE